MENTRKQYQREYREDYKKRTKYVNVAIPMDDFKRLQTLAKDQNKKVSPYLRELAFAQLDGSTILSTELEEALREHNLLIRNIANNINQLAHSANIFHDIDRNVVFDHLKQLDQTVQRFVDKKANDDS